LFGHDWIYGPPLAVDDINASIAVLLAGTVATAIVPMELVSVVDQEVIAVTPLTVVLTGE
jgi:hypothetical protein